MTEHGNLDDDPTDSGSHAEDLPTADHESADSGALFGLVRPGPIPHERIPDRVGPYRVSGRIGRGGMGTVLKASDERATGRRVVAIKVVRRGVDTEDILRRFEMERRVLSALDHPNIARFYEAGETEDGRPYFVMEYIEGQPIDAYCDANNLGIRARLEVFRKVCSAVHYAHTNLIVHRDLKPANILVTPSGEPKLLDFGIAKFLNPQLAQAVAVTGPGVRLMTPEYASPEQVRGDPVNTLSDVYSLGVLLYELLSGHRPYQLASRLEQEVIRVISDVDPERPSTAISRIERLTRSDGTAESITPDIIAKRRGSRPDTLRRQLSGDLDDIVMTALQKAPASRYATAHDLAEDLERHLKGDPVVARRASRPVLYRAKKFVRRHPTGVGIAATFSLALLIGASAVIWQWKEKAQAERLAWIAQQEAKEAELETNLAHDAIDGALRRLQGQWIEEYLPPAARRRYWTEMVVELKALAAESHWSRKSMGLPLARACMELGQTLGGKTRQSASNLGDHEGALRAHRVAIELLEKMRSETPADQEVLGDLALAHIYAGDTLRAMPANEREAAGEYRKAIAILEGLPQSARQVDLYCKRLSAAKLSLGDSLRDQCDFAEAEAVYLGTLEDRKRRTAERPDDEYWERQVATAYGHCADLEDLRSNSKAAVDDRRRVLAMCEEMLLNADRRVNPGDVAATSRKPLYRRRVVSARLYLASSLIDAGQPGQAIEALEPTRTLLQAMAAEDSDQAQVDRIACKVEIERCRAFLGVKDFQQSFLANHNAQRANEAFAEHTMDKQEVMEHESTLGYLQGEALLGLDEADQAESALAASLSGVQGMLVDDPVDTDLLRQRALVQRCLGDACMQLAERADPPAQPAAREALDWYRRADETYEQMKSIGRFCGVPEAELAAVRQGLERAQRAVAETP